MVDRATIAVQAAAAPAVESNGQVAAAFVPEPEGPDRQRNSLKEVATAVLPAPQHPLG